MILVVGLLASLAGARAVRFAQRAQERADFEVSATKTAEVVQARLDGDLDLMAALRGLVLAHPHLTNSEFAAWYDAAEVAERFPGGVGFGYVARVPAASLDDFVAAAAADPVVGLPAGFVVTPPGARQEYCLQEVGVWMVSSVQGLQIPAGMDFCADDIAGEPSPLPEVLAQATDTGHASVLTPEQLTGTTFAVVLPVYRDGSRPATVEERRAASVGWVAGSFDARDLVTAGRVQHDEIWVAVERVVGSTTATVASSPGEAPAAASELVLRADADGQWTVRVADLAETSTWDDWGRPLGVLAGGAALSCLIFVVIRLLGLSRSRALAMVEQRTRQLAHQAMHDSLTGLPNRALVLDRAEQLRARAGRASTGTAALFVDLDDFKAVNDTLGHGAGDQLLVAVAQRLRTVVRDADTVGRVGGDEFVVLIDGTDGDPGVVTVAERILDALVEPVVLGSHEVVVSASIGIAPGPGATTDEWLRDADVALYEAKAAGKHGYVVFQPGMLRRADRQVVVERDRPTSATPT